MKKYIVTYTKDFGTTYESCVVESESYTGAYIIVDFTLPRSAAITDICQAVA